MMDRDSGGDGGGWWRMVGLKRVLCDVAVLTVGVDSNGALEGIVLLLGCREG